MAAEYERLAAELNTALAEPPTANSVADMIHADGSYTYDNTTDSLEAIRNAIDALSTLTNKERAFLGVGAQPALKETFLDVADAADPDSTYWTTVEDGTAAVARVNGGTNYMRIQTGNAADNDAIIHTMGNIAWGSVADGVTTLFMRARVYVVDLTGEALIGFVNDDYGGNDLDSFKTGAVTRSAVVHVDNDVINFHTSNGSAEENTDVSGDFAQATWVEIQIELTSTTSVLRLDTSNVTTHSTTPAPEYVYSASASTRNSNSVQSDMLVELIEVWTE